MAEFLLLIGGHTLIIIDKVIPLTISNFATSKQTHIRVLVHSEKRWVVVKYGQTQCAVEIGLTQHLGLSIFSPNLG